MRADKKPKAKPEPVKIKIVFKSFRSTVKKRKRIRPRTPEREAQYLVYRILREEFFLKSENQMCAVYPYLRACDVHHMKGKLGEMLNDVRWWLPVSREGHDWIDLHPKLAKERGFSGDRLSMTDELNENV